MSRRARLKLISLGTASMSLLALVCAFVLPSGGCGEGRETIFADQGKCESNPDDENPCTVDTCEGGAVKHVPVADGATCALGMNDGVCKGGVCDIGCDMLEGECPCQSRTDCVPDTDCVTYTCSDSKCLPNIQAGKVLPPEKQTQGDCQDVTCTAEGEPTGMMGNEFDVPIPSAGSVCKVGQCTMGSPSVVPANMGTSCVLAGGMQGVCAAMEGGCAPCLDGNGNKCASGETCYDLNGTPTCTSCGNGMKDGDETDVDCGGTCATCLPGGPCKKCGLGQFCGEQNANCDGLSCVDKVCCENSCGADCKKCEAGTGKCIDVAAGIPDVCENPKVCIADTGCKARAGASCSTNNDCMSAECVSMKCNKSDTGEPCIENSDCSGSKVCNDANVCQ